MVHSVIYGMRGWIAFVAFIEFSNAIRCFSDDSHFLNNIFHQTNTLTPVTIRLFGRYFFLNGIIMTHCALFIHHMPVISISICSLTLLIFLHISEAFYYFTSVLNFYVVFPMIISSSTILCLIIAPFFLEDVPKPSNVIEEQEESEDEYEVEENRKKGRQIPVTLSSSQRKLKTN